MKKRILQYRMTAKALMIMLLLGVVRDIYAYDFSAVCETGQTLYFNIIDSENYYVELTYPGNNEVYSWTGFDSPSGNITIPSFVNSDNQVYEVTSIGNYAFSTCNGLTGSLIIPNTVNTIGNWAFKSCYGFNGTLFIPNSVTTIGSGAFSNCHGFTGNLVIPNSVTTINSGAFEQCYGFNGYLTISNSITNINTGVFFNCHGFIGSLDIPNSVKWIFDAAFSGCSGFTGSLNIPNSVIQIGEETFSNCSGFDGALILGNSVRTLGYHAFVDCGNFSSLVCLASLPPTIEWNAFYRFPMSIPVYVPYNTINAYMATLRWNEFTNYHEMAYKTIPGYVESDGLWQFIASPLVEITSPETVDNMMSETDYDLYQFDPTESDIKWQNHKADNFDLVNGQGYLYASKEEVNIIFKGEFNEDETKVVELVYDEGSPNAGWNLVGNPFPVSAYINRDYYIMNEDGTGINPVAVPASTPIPPCTGVMVRANGAGETVVFSKTAP